MANIEINVDNKKYTKSSDNKKLIKTNTLKEKASADVEEVDLDSETYNVESTKTEVITTDSANENYNMSSSEIKSLTKKLKKVKKEYIKNYEDLEVKYIDISNKEWYENGVLTTNPTTNLPYTPGEYKNLLMTNNNIMTEDELAKNKALKGEIDVYSKAYEKQFEQIMGISYSEYKELKESYKSDLTILDNTISSLSSLAKEQNYNEVLDTDSFKSYMSTKSKMTFSDLEKNYNEYNSKSADITESAEASINMYDTYNPMYIIEYAEKLAEQEKFDITDVLEKQVQSYQYDLSDFYEYYKVMTDDEKNLYSYYFETKGREAAEKYFNDMKDSWNKKIAYNRFQEDVSDLDLTDEGAVKESIANILNVNVDGIGDGINQFMSGIANSITNNKEITIEEYKTMYYLSYLEQNSKILSTSYKVGTATGNMLPSVTASVLTAIIAPEIAPSISQGLIGVSSFGNSKHNALIQGYSLPTSILYGVMSGSSEVLFEKFGGIIGIADNPGSNAIIRALKEGVEEGAQSYIQAGIDAVVLGKEINLDDMNDDAKESFIVGMLVAYTTNVYSKGLSDSINFIQNGEKISISKEEILNLLDSKINDKSLNAVDKNVLFINDMFDSILNKFKVNNKSSSSKESISLNSTMDSIVSDLYKNGYNAWVRIGEYYNSGNIEYIPENLRSTIKEIPKSEIYNFLTSAEANTKYGTNYASPLDSVISTINNEGYNGWSRLYKYYESGDISYLPESVRSTVENISKDEIYNFLVSPGNNYKYGTDYMTNIAKIVSKLNKEGYDGWNVISQYIKSGDINCIPKSARSKIMDIPKTKISSFLSSQSAYYKYSKGTSPVRSMEEFESTLKTPITDENIKKMVEKTYTREGYSEYFNFVTMQTDKQKLLPSQAQITSFLNRFSGPNYTKEEQATSFLHIYSSDFDLGATAKRLYVNADYDVTLNFMEQFANKCEQRNIPFYFKTADFKANVGEGSLIRDESLVIYSDNQHFLDYVNICDEIKRENPDMKFYSPPIFTGVHNEYLGYGEEPVGGGVSFNSVRAPLVMNAIKSSMAEMKKIYNTNQEADILNSANLYKEYRNRIYQKIYNSSSGFNINPNKFYANYGN